MNMKHERPEDPMPARVRGPGKVHEHEKMKKGKQEKEVQCAPGELLRQEGHRMWVRLFLSQAWSSAR